MSAGPPSSRLDRKVLVTAEVLLLLVSVATTLGFARLFRDDSYRSRLLILVVATHVVAAACRRLRLSVAWAAVVSFGALLVVGSSTIYPKTTWALLPTATTKRAAFHDLHVAWDLFGQVRAPAQVEVGFVVAAGLAMWVVGFLADWAAFRLWSTVEAVLPAGIVFLFAALLGRGAHRYSSTVWFAGAVLVFALGHRLAKSELGASWLARDPNDGRLALGRLGLIGAGIAVALGLVVGPALPGAGDEALLAWRNLDGSGGSAAGTRVTVSPLVDIQARLFTQSALEVFTVEATQPDYWRLTALDKFDGTAWTSSGQYVKAKDSLPSRLPAAVATTTVTQTFRIEALSALWMPAAYEPAAVIDDGGSGARYEADSGTLTVKEGKSTSDELTYTIESRIPQRTAAEVKGADNTALDPEFRLRYTEVPSSVSNYITGFLGREGGRNGGLRGLRASGKTPYDQALQLQNFFRSAFTYDLNVAAGQSITDIQSFLNARRGYCEQFAGTFAAIMRVLNVPARVAVGFTPGELGSDGLYHVRGEHAHAWPEVYIDNVGWIRFEPTPGRGAPGDEAVTGVAPAQAETGNAQESAPVTTAPPVTSDSSGADTPLGDLADLGLDTIGGGAGSTPKSDSSLSGIGQLLLIAGGVLAAGMLVFGAVPFVKHVRRRRRARRATDPRQKVTVSWADAVDSLALLGVPVRDSDTPAQIVGRVSEQLGEATGDLRSLAQLTTAANYAPIEPEPAAVEAAARSAQAVRASVARRVSRRTKIKRALDPRPLLPRTTLRG